MEVLIGMMIFPAGIFLGAVAIQWQAKRAGRFFLGKPTHYHQSHIRHHKRRDRAVEKRFISLMHKK